MAILTVKPETKHRDWDDVRKFHGRFAAYTYQDEQEEWDLTHRTQWATVAAAAGGGSMLDPLHRYLAVKNMGLVPVLLHLNTQANAPNPAFEVTILPGHWVEFVDLWISVQPSIRVDSALYSQSVECEVLQIGLFTSIEEEPEDFCDMWAVGHTVGDGVMTKHHPEVPGPWATIASTIVAADHWLADVAGVAEDDYWAVGYELSGGVPTFGIFSQWTGGPWAEVAVADDPPMFGVWGFSANDYWAVGGIIGGPGQIWRWTGGPWAFDAWADGDQGERTLFCVHGDIPANVYAGGELGLIVWWNGVGWASVGASPDPDFDLFNFYGTWTSPTQTSLVCGGTAPWLGTPGGIGAIYRQVAPAVWLPDPINLQEPPTLRAMWGFHDQDVWAVGDDKTILRWIGGPMWEPVAGPAELDPYTIHYRGVFGCWPWAVWAIGTDEITGNNVIIYWDGLTWTVDHGINLAEGDLLGLKGVWVGEVPV